MSELFAPGRIWEGKPVVVVASGPSLSLRQARTLGMARDADRCRVIAVSDGVFPCWFADVCYSGDARWWDHHKGLMSFPGIRVSRSQMGRYGVNYMRFFEMRNGYDPEPGNLRYGPNSAHQAVHIGAQLGGSEIIAVGMDYSDDGARDHYFGRHEGRMDMCSDTAKWRAEFRVLTDELQGFGVKVLNASLSSTIKWLQPVSLESRFAQ